MAKQVINIGVTANDGSGDPLRTAFNICNDNFTELYEAIAALQGGITGVSDFARVVSSEACSGTADEVIAFGTQFVETYTLTIIDFEGLGIEVTSQDEDGFTITSLTAGNFAYVAIIES